MAADENSFWRTHVKAKLSDYLYMKRVHRAQDPGIPDVTWIMKPAALQLLSQPILGIEQVDARSGWTELKVCRKVDLKLPISPEQLFFLQDWSKFAGRASILLQDHRAASNHTPRFTYIKADSSYAWVMAMQHRDWRDHESCTHMQSFDVKRIIGRLNLVGRWGMDVYTASLR